MSHSLPVPTVSATVLTAAPRRLQALCELWRDARRDVWVTLQGGSMIPTIRPGARIRLQCGDYTPSLGEVIAFRQEGRLVIHRLREVNSEGLLICQGDANTQPDEPVALQDVAGRVVEIQPAFMMVRLREEMRHAKRALRRIRGRIFRKEGAR